MKRLAIVLFMTMLLATPCRAETCHDLVMSYIEHDQDPRNIGDTIKTGAQNEPVLMATTAYYQGNIGSHGDRMKEGYVAFSPETYGAAVTIYEAIPQENGTFTIGELIDIFEIRDTGYGFSTGEGESIVRSDKKYAGTIESGLHLDVYRDNLLRCREWMQLTGGMCFAVVVQGKG